MGSRSTPLMGSGKPGELRAPAGAAAGPTADLRPGEDRRILRKIDMCLLPLMAITYMFQFMDRSALGSAAILSLPSDLRLSGTDFSWASGIYFLGYLLASYPAAAIIVRWRVGKMIAATVLLLGGVLMLSAAVTNAASLLAARFFLGVAEAPVAPGLTIVVAMWYKRSEQPPRHAAWFSGALTAGLAAYDLGHVRTIAAWRAVFLVFGAATVGWSVALVWLLPDVPISARFLNEADRAKAVARVEDNMTGIKNNQFKWCQCREALLDSKTWFFVVIQLCGNIPNGGLISFGSIIIQGLGFDRFRSLFLQSVVSSFVLVMLGSTAVSSYVGNSITYLSGEFGLALLGAVIVRQRPPEARWVRYAGFCLTMTYSTTFPLLMSVTSTNVGGFTKKVTVNAVSFIAYCVSNIIGPHLFVAREAPSYHSGFLAVIICFSIGLGTCMALRLYLTRENRMRDQAYVKVGDGGSDTELNWFDMTDKEMTQFRYVY